MHLIKWGKVDASVMFVVDGRRCISLETIVCKADNDVKSNRLVDDTAT